MNTFELRRRPVWWEIEIVNEAPRDVFEFGSVTLDVSLGRVFRNGTEVALRPKSLALLIHMVRGAGRVLSKDELIAAIWPDVVVTEDSLTRCIHEIRTALGPDGARLIRTVARRGYLFEGTAAVAPAVSQGEGAPLRPDGIAVLPFTLAMSDDPGAPTLMLGLVQDVINRLSTLKGLHVISLGSAFAAQQAVTDPRAVGSALGVLYVVTGTGESQSDRVRIRIEISEARKGTTVWTGEYSEVRANFLELVGGVTDKIAQALHSQVWAAERRRVLSLPVESLDAWEQFHFAVACLVKSDPASLDLALERFRAAASISPGFARAWAGQSAVSYVRVMSGLSQDVQADVVTAMRCALKAVELDIEDPYSQWSLGRAFWLGGDVAGARQALERGIALSPSLALCHYELGLIEALQGDPRRAISEVEIFQSLSPFDPVMASALLSRGFAHFRLGETEEAVKWTREAVRLSYVFASIHVPAALILADCGHQDEARLIISHLLAVAPYPGAEAMAGVLARQSGLLRDLFDRHWMEIGLPQAPQTPAPLS